jgi:serine/threonine protein phosphatase PrpC
MKYNYRSLTNVGKVRKANEDSCGEFKTPHGTLLIVCDGMGGHVGGAVASSTAVEKVYEYINNRDSSLGYQTLLQEAIIFANEQVFGLSTVKPELKGMGTTCVVVLISDSGLVYYAHVGDSRLYLLRDKTIKRVTKDHSLVQLLHDQGQITEDEMETHPNKNQILKAIGTDFDLRPEVCKEPMQMKENDILLICSDGLCGMVHDRDIARITYANISNLENATQLLIDEANNNGGKDNITATLVTFGQPQDQKVVMAAAPIQNTESSKNNKKLLLYGGMAVLLLVLVGFLVWGRGGTTEQTFCKCYETLADKVNNQQTDSLKVSVYDSGVKECEKNEKKDQKCTKKADLEKTIAPVKEAEDKRLEKEKDGKKEPKNDENTQNPKGKEEQKKPNEPKKTTTTTVTDPSTTTVTTSNGKCKQQINHEVKDKETLSLIASSYKKDCNDLDVEDLKAVVAKPDDIKPGDKITFTCKCKDK